MKAAPFLDDGPTGVVLTREGPAQSVKVGERGAGAAPQAPRAQVCWSVLGPSGMGRVPPAVGRGHTGGPRNWSVPEAVVC